MSEEVGEFQKKVFLDRLDAIQSDIKKIHRIKTVSGKIKELKDVIGRLVKLDEDMQKAKIWKKTPNLSKTINDLLTWRRELETRGCKKNRIPWGDDKSVG